MKLAILSNMSIDIEKKFSILNFESVSSIMSDKVEFHDFENTLDFCKILHKLMGNNTYTIANYHYDNTYLIQAIYVETGSNVYDKIMLIKRFIHDKDTYTFAEYDFENSESVDVYKYDNITFDDIVNIIINNNVVKGVECVYNGDMNNIEMIDTIKDKYEGILIVKKGNIETEYSYMNISNIINEKMHENEKVTEDEITEKINEQMKSTTQLFYKQFDVKIGILNCFIPLNAENKNEQISSILDGDVYGTVFVYFENTMNDDPRILQIDKNLLQKIFNVAKSGEKIKQTNIHFWNIYAELL